jgi:transcriptional regulator with XRE-family HTH domain
MVTETEKMPRAPAKKKTRFGQCCKKLRQKQHLTLKDAARLMACSQPYITRVENGTEKLTFEFLQKCISVYTQNAQEDEPEEVALETKFELMYWFISTLEKVELDLSKINIVHRENLNQVITALLLDSKYPMTAPSYNPLYWNHINAFLENLNKDLKERSDEIALYRQEQKKAEQQYLASLEEDTDE